MLVRNRQPAQLRLLFSLVVMSLILGTKRPEELGAMSH